MGCGSDKCYGLGGPGEPILSDVSRTQVDKGGTMPLEKELRAVRKKRDGSRMLVLSWLFKSYLKVAGEFRVRP